MIVPRMEKPHRVPHRHRPKGLEIVFEDRDIVVIEKESGLLTWSPHKDQPQTAERILTEYLRRGNARSRLRAYTVHRLDRETSGLLVFAKSESVQQQLKEHWRDTEKRYFAVVHGVPRKKQGTVSGYLAENENQFVYVTKNEKDGKWAETRYAVLKETKSHAALEVGLATGRKNQIRVHLASIGHPVVGDRKYGAKVDRAARMALHAMHLEFDHPYSDRRMVFDSPVPPALLKLVGGWERPGSAGGKLAAEEKKDGPENAEARP